MLHLQNISKSFSGVKALNDVSFNLQRGEVHALCGENGAGKSTLMNIICGNFQPDEGGKIIVEDQSITLRYNQDARKHGIAIVYQERSLIDSLSVAENIFINNPPANKYGKINYRQLYQKTESILTLLQLPEVLPHTLVKDLSPAKCQMIEIAKALASDPKVLILDEPTASITEKETQVLFNIIRRLTTKGVGVIYISHRLNEIFQIAQRVTILKDGKWQATLPVSEVNEAQLIQLMVGREFKKQAFQSLAQKDIALQVKSLTGLSFSEISFSIAKGEIVALAGLVGAGRTEIAKTIFGALPKKKGEILLDGEPCNFDYPAQAIAKGVAYLAEERKLQSIFPDMTITENMMSARFAGSGFQPSVPNGNAVATAGQYREKLRIVTPSLQKKMKQLSGGNQQKVILARWLNINPRVLIVDEPTQGVDVGAKFEIYQILHELAGKGTAILLISSEMPEVLALANRIVVISKGKMAGEVSGAKATEENILTLASGFSIAL